MIPKNITREDIIRAMKQVDEVGAPKNRMSRTYYAVYEGKFYPPKYIVSLANLLVNGEELTPQEFGGGLETNNFLKKLGFEIIPAFDVETEHCGNCLSVTTAVLESESDYFYNASYEELNLNRFKLIENLLRENLRSDVLLLPAGFFELPEYSKNEVIDISNAVISLIEKANAQTIICFGVDCEDGAHQLAVAVNKEKIVAMGRKFHPTDAENGFVEAASDFDACELGYERFFNIKDKKFYMAVCYDCFGIRHNNIPACGVDVVLTLAHRFHRKGEGPSGEVDFARKGFAGTSQHWNCDVFGTAVFFDRKVPPMWPTGVRWVNKTESVKHFKYDDNQLKYDWKKTIDFMPENVTCYGYNL